MRNVARTVPALLVLVALTFGVWPTPGLAGARLDGTLTGVDGHPAAGYTVVLLDPSGRTVDSTRTSTDGVYGFSEVPEGSYALGIESPDGLAAPVGAPPLRVAENTKARRDIRLARVDARQQAGAATGNYFGLWWAGLRPAAKVWVVIGAISVVGVTVAALDDDDDDAPASPFTP